MSRPLEILILILAAPFLLIPAAFAALCVRLTSDGPVLYWSERVGQHSRTFAMPKFRTMRVGTPAVATHLLANPESALTPAGGMLRKTSLDELPQLWSVLVGDMALVGPRPALYNQDDLIALRAQQGVDRLRPGITGWAQVRGRDTLTIPQKVALDAEYLKRRSAAFDFQILFATAFKLVGDRTVSH